LHEHTAIHGGLHGHPPSLSGRGSVRARIGCVTRIGEGPGSRGIGEAGGSGPPRPLGTTCSLVLVHGCICLPHHLLEREPFHRRRGRRADGHRQLIGTGACGVEPRHMLLETRRHASSHAGPWASWDTPTRAAEDRRARRDKVSRTWMLRRRAEGTGPFQGFRLPASSEQAELRHSSVSCR
jgi:hypothetical protein